MEKQKLNRFVQKYTLGGLIESVKWESDGNTLQTSFISDDKSVLGSLSMTDSAIAKSEFGVYDTSKLKNMLNVLGPDVDFEISSAGEKAVSLKFKDKLTSINYMLADLSVIPNVPDLKQLPPFDIQIKLDTNFINKFIKAKSALADENNFAFISKGGKSTIVIGHSNINTNKISIEVDATTEGDVSPMYFSATYLKEILVANKDASDATLNISSQGLAHIQFEIDEYKSNYYLVKIEA